MALSELKQLLKLEDPDVSAVFGLLVGAMDESNEVVEKLREENLALSGREKTLRERVGVLEAKLAASEENANTAEDTHTATVETHTATLSKLMRGAVIVVDQAGSSTFRDIPSAISVAQSGDTIVVRPGTYKEPLILTTPDITILGAGVDRTSLIHTSDCCSLVFRTSATLTGFTIEGAGPHNSAVRFEGGESGDGILKGCRVSSTNLSCVVVVKGRPRIEDCIVWGSKQHGICCKQQTSPVVVDCEVSGCKQPNIVVDTGASPTLERCRIFGSEQNGVWFRAGSAGFLRECEVFGNAFSNVDISSNATPIVSDCRIHSSEKCGVCVADRGGGVIENCDIYQNSYSNIGLMAGVTVSVISNTIHHSKQHGILIKTGAKGDVSKNALHSNELANIKLEQGAETLVENNTR